MKVRVFAKSALDLRTKEGAYAYSFFAGVDQIKGRNRFKHRTNTLTLADCAAFVNALHWLSRKAIAPIITEIEIVTDSSKVEPLLSVFKADKGCEEIARHWREKGKPAFPALENMIFKKVTSKPLLGDKDNFILQQLYAVAQGELQTMSMITS